MSHTEIVRSGKYSFKITRNVVMFRDAILIHTYKVGLDCVNISYFYENNKPIRVKIPHLLYEPECAVGSSLENGGGTEIMIKTAIRYAYNDVKSLTNFEFEDNSNIDCTDLTESPPRKNAKPLNLAYFYIVYHGMTWYEARFNAEMIDKAKYKIYKEKLKFLTDPSEKVSFKRFTEIIGSNFDSADSVLYLEKLYNNANTYRGFFESIPKSKRCDILYPWLNSFMEHYLDSIYSHTGWFINIHKMDSPKQVGGSLKKGPHYRIYSYRKTQNL